MVSKKHPLYKLEKKRNSFLAIGFMVSLFFVLTAMEWTTATEKPKLMTVSYEPPEPPDPYPPTDPPKKRKKKEDEDDNKVKERVDGEGKEKKKEEEEEHKQDSIFIPIEIEIIIEDPPPPPARIWAENMPEFKGGEQARIDYLQKHVKYTQRDIDADRVGTVWVSFIVSPKGKIQLVKLERGIGGKCDEAVIRAVKAMPRWIPGNDGENNVAVRLNMSFEFTLE